MKNKITTRKKIFILSLSLITIISAILTFIFVFSNKVEAIEIKKAYGKYESTQDIYKGKENTNTSTFISMTDAANSTSIENKTITIATPSELILFSNLCDPKNKSYNENFLGYNYKLLNNIDCSKNTDSFIPIGYDKAFSGTFDGNGFEIKYLNFINLVSNNENVTKYLYSSDNETNTHIQYFAMFSKNNGTIKNLGLISPRIVLSYNPRGAAYIAPLVGENNGTVECCYHKMLESNEDNSSGISSQGGFFVSGLVSINTKTGKISYVYSAVSILSQTASTEVLTQAEIVNVNSGTVENAYFYDSTIRSYVENNNKVSITFDPSKVNSDLKDADHPGIFCNSLSDLTSKISNTKSNYYSLNSYNETIQKYLKNSNNEFIYETPILRGIKNANGNILTINNANEFYYMYELFNLNSHFASSEFTYVIANDIDMSLIGIPTVTTQINATIKSSNENSNITIFNAPISDYYITNMGIDCYGLFPWFSGKLSNIDVVLGSTNTKYQFTPKESNNKKAFGALVGYLDGGEIDNCNVYINATFDDNINEYSVGGVVGYLGSISNSIVGTISNTIVNGTIENTSSSSSTATTNFNKLGGLVGFIDYTTGSITNVLSTVSIISNAKSNLAIGGILGAGYINKFLNNQYGKKVDSTLNGTITINGSFEYASGIIGRLLGVSNQIDSITNYGNISLNSQSNNESYLSSLMNVDIIKTATTTLSVSSLPLNNSGEYLFYASQLNSDCNIAVNGKNLKMHLSNGLNINTKNAFTTKITGLYNSTTKSGNSSSLYLNNISNFSGLINSICDNDTSSMVYLDTVLNSKNYTFNSNNTIEASITVSSIANGKNINFVDIRNNGNLSFELDNQTSNNPNLIINGVFEELSLNTSANNIYNAGNITIMDNGSSTSSSVETINIDIYVSGICYKNLAQITDDSQNPLKASYDNTLVGSLNNVINNGMITVSSKDFDKTMSAYEKSSGGQATLVTQSSKSRLKGNIYASGITYLNEGIISNTFNIANIELDIFSRKYNSEYIVAGIASFMNGQYAQIRDSANDGTLQAINIANNKNANDAYIFVGGIVGKNNYEGNSNLTSINSIISFSINYGTLVAFNATENIAIGSDISNKHCYVSGILAFGAINMVNVVNYGDIYGTEVVSSLIAGFNMGIYAKTDFYLANTINYGKINLLEKYHYEGSTFNKITFNDVDIINNSKALSYTTSGLYETSGSVTKYYYLGAMFGVVDFKNGSAATPKIRYVINFYSAPIVQSSNQINLPTAAIDTTTFITVNGSTDTFGNGRIKYAPMTSVSDSNGNIGVFSKDFIFRKALDKNKEAVDFDNYLTDNYISDFFEFVRFDKINTVLLDKIGWRSIAYLNASEILAKNLKLMSVFVNKDNLTKTTFEDAFSSTTWIENIDIDLLSDFLAYSFQSNELNTDYQTIINKIIFDSNYSSAITKTIRNNIISKMVEYCDKNNYQSLLQDLLYDELLAKMISGENQDYSSVQNKIRTLLSNASSEELRTTLDKYLESLLKDSDNAVLKKIFDDDENNYYLQKKVDLINTLLEGYSDEALSTMANDIINNSSDSSLGLKAYNYLKSETGSTTAKNIYAIMVASGNTSEEYINVLNKSFKKYDINTILTDDIINNVDISSYYTGTDTDTTSKYTYVNGTKISYTNDYTELWNIVKNDAKFQEALKTKYFKSVTDPTSSINYSALIAKATEYNNTYQSNDAPSSLDSSDNNDKRGILQITSDNAEIKNRFIYTPDSVNSTATYYYGPFDKDGNLFSKKLTNPESCFGRDIYNMPSTGNTSDGYTPVFISVNKGITEEHIASSNTTANNKVISPFFWHDTKENPQYTRGQWVSNYIIKSNAGKSDCIGYIYKNSNISDYIVDGYSFDPTYKPSCYNDKNIDTIITTSNGNETVKLLSNTSTNHEYSSNYLVGYITSSIYTGIWYTTSYWVTPSKEMVGVYLMSQDVTQHEVDGYRGVQTTQYTYYQMDDLVKLDGIRTKSKDNPTAKDGTEISIISAIMTDLLTNNSNKKIIMEAVANYAKNNSFKATEINTVNLLSKSLIGTDFAKNSIAEDFTLLNQTILGNIVYNDANNTDITTLYKKFEEIINDSSVTFTNKQNLSMAGATDKETFKKILLATLTNIPKYYESGTTEISNYDFTYFIYKYISYLKENGIEDTEIINYLKSSNNDFNILNALTSLDWDSYITMIGGDADASGSGIGYNSSTDLKELYDKLNSSDVTKDNGTPYVPKAYALPISNVSSDFITPSTKSTSIELSSGTKTVSTATTQLASNNNIGYYVGAELKLYKQTGIDYSNLYYPNTSDSSTLLDNNQNHPIPADSIKSYLNDERDDAGNKYKNGDYLMRIASSQQIINGSPTNEGNLVYIENGQVGNYTGGILVPIRTIWVAPVKAGVFKFVIVNIESSKTSFSVHKLTRSNPGHYDSYLTKSETIMTFNEILLSNKAYYFEIAVTDEDIKAGYEYAISGGDSKKPYVAYIDMGTSGSDTTTKQYPDLKTIESNYNTYYIDHSLNSTSAKLSKFGLYLASNFISSNNEFTNSMTITVSKPTILLIKGKNGSVTVSGKTEYAPPDSTGKPNTSDTTEKISTDSVKKSFAAQEEYRAFYLSGDDSTTGVTYTITATNCEITDILLVDAGASFTKTSNNTNTIDTIKIKHDANSNEQILYTGSLYENINTANTKLVLGNYKNKIIETLLTIYPTYVTKKDNKDQYLLFNESYFKNFDFKDFITSLAAADYYDYEHSVFGTLLKKMTQDQVKEILSRIKDTTVMKNIMDVIIKIVNEDTNNMHSTIETYIIAAYLGQDYLNNTKQLTKTKLYELLNNYKDKDHEVGYYQFIQDDTTIIPDKFIEFIEHLGGSADIEGYGIFALASSQGIRNGKFIPDNLELGSMDVKNYNTDGTFTTDSTWRGGNADNANNTSNQNSVNYHFYVSMKQLKKSISTSIIEMDLIDSNNNKYFANNNQITINGSTGTITYYITKSQYDSINGSFTIDRDNLVIASKATIYIGLNDSYNELNDNNKTFTVTKANNTLTTDTKIKVIAEDTTVETIYDINFIIIDNDTTDYTYTLTSDVTLESTGGDVTLTFTTTNPNLNNSDLSSFINIEKDNKSYNYLNNRDEFKKYFSFYTTGFYQVVKKNDSNYVATIKYSVNQSLPYGDYKVSINVGTKPFITMTKNANSEANIEYIEFDHQSIKVSATMESSILFGRTFEKNDFIMNEDNIPNYLTDFRISSNATVMIKYEITTTNSGLRQFIVTYDITAENGITKNKYTHTLAEKAPFDSDYATIYKDGNILATDTTNVEYALVNNTNISASDKLNLSFTRNEGVPTYRIYFNLNNFYIDSNTSFGLEDKSETNKIGMSHMATSYAGLTASVTENCELGTYSYQYSYTDKLGRIFYFPIVNITKEYSTDSLISELTFISSNISLGSAYTRVNPNYAFIPNENTSDNQKNYHYDENEKYYSDFKNSDVTVTNGKMVYSDNASLSGTNYYILGTVSDVQLSDYAPTMIVDEYAEVYQYTTPNKIIKYNGNQTQSDTDILKTNSSNNIVYLYVPFYTDDNQNGNEDETDTHSVYLVKMTIENGKKIISTVYNTSGVSDNDKVGEFNKNSELKNIHSLSITVGGKTYYVSKYAGKKGNVSLNMNYIGNPSDGHFWYVSYAVFSESYLYKDSDTASINYYHISIVDLTNNIYFKIKVNTDKQFENSAIYLTISYVTYDKDNNQISNTLSCYAIKLNELNNDIYTFTTQYDLAMLPSGYFKFYLELPHGYSVTYTASKENKLTNTDTYYEDNKGSYLPPSSVVPQQIELIFNVKETTDISNSLWGEGTTSTVTKEAEYQSSTKS